MQLGRRTASLEEQSTPQLSGPTNEEVSSVTQKQHKEHMKNTKVFPYKEKSDAFFMRAIEAANGNRSPVKHGISFLTKERLNWPGAPVKISLSQP